MRKLVSEKKSWIGSLGKSLGGVFVGIVLCYPLPVKAHLKRLIDLPVGGLGQAVPLPASLETGDKASQKVSKRRGQGRLKPVGVENLQSLIEPILKEKGFSPDAVQVQIETPREGLFLSYDQDEDLYLLSWDLHQRQNRLTLVLESSKNPGRPMTCQLRLDPLVEVPVLAHGLGADHLVGPDDIQFLKVQARQISRHTVTKVDDLLGALVRPGAAMPQRLLKKSDIHRPQWVKRGQTISVIVKKGGLRLETVAKSLEAGEQGQMIRLVNLQSHRAIQATVIGPGQAEMDLTSPHLYKEGMTS